MILTKTKPDSIGVLASTLCLIHCVATPFIFLLQSSALSCCNEIPVWWGFIDYFFLIISLMAVYRSTQITSKNWIKPSLWISWLALFIIIVNEKMAWFSLHERFVYVPAIALILLHVYNKKHCQCQLDTCCTTE